MARRRAPQRRKALTIESLPIQDLFTLKDGPRFADEKLSAERLREVGELWAHLAEWFLPSPEDPTGDAMLDAGHRFAAGHRAWAFWKFEARRPQPGWEEEPHALQRMGALADWEKIHLRHSGVKL